MKNYKLDKDVKGYLLTILKIKKEDLNNELATEYIDFIISEVEKLPVKN